MTAAAPCLSCRGAAGQPAFGSVCALPVCVGRGGAGGVACSKAADSQLLPQRERRGAASNAKLHASRLCLQRASERQLMQWALRQAQHWGGRVKSGYCAEHASPMCLYGVTLLKPRRSIV